MQLSHLQRGKKLGSVFPFLNLEASIFTLLSRSPARAAGASRGVWPQNQSSLVASGSSGSEVGTALPPAPPPPGSGRKGPGSGNPGPRDPTPAPRGVPRRAENPARLRPASPPEPDFGLVKRFQSVRFYSGFCRPRVQPHKWPNKNTCLPTPQTSTTNFLPHSYHLDRNLEKYLLVGQIHDFP